jgi:SRSO17 transposase
VDFATKPALAQQMIIRALDGDGCAPWVAADEVYGADPGLRDELERRGVGRCWPWRAATPSPPRRASYARLRLSY